MLILQRTCDEFCSGCVFSLLRRTWKCIHRVYIMMYFINTEFLFNMRHVHACKTCRTVTSRKKDAKTNTSVRILRSCHRCHEPRHIEVGSMHHTGIAAAHVCSRGWMRVCLSWWRLRVFSQLVTILVFNWWPDLFFKELLTCYDIRSDPWTWARILLEETTHVSFDSFRGADITPVWVNIKPIQRKHSDDLDLENCHFTEKWEIAAMPHFKR